MVDANNSGSGALFPSDDGMSKMADMFANLTGREMSSEGVRMLVFLEQNGSRDVAAAIISKKRYMAGAGDITGFLKHYSPASYAKDMLDAQQEAAAKRAAGM